MEGASLTSPPDGATTSNAKLCIWDEFRLDREWVDCPYALHNERHRTFCPRTAALAMLGQAPEEESKASELVHEPSLSDDDRGHGMFTPVEDAVIIRAKQPTPHESWWDVAKRLPGRTMEQCLRRWYYYLAPEVRSVPWTPEEDELLIQKVNEMGRRWSAMKPFFNVRSIADIFARWHHHVESRTVHDGTKFVWKDRDTDCPFAVRNKESDTKLCPRKVAPAILEAATRQEIPKELHRACRPVPEQILDRPTRPRRPFTPEEDALLIRARQSTFMPTWCGLAQGIPGRSVRECRERWLNYHAGKTRSEPWTPEEDELLIEKVNELGRRWGAMAPFFDGRSVTNIRNRWYQHLRLEKKTR
jgi:hypothetical protein